MTGTQDIGSELFGLASELFPICRSISGDGVRQTLDILGRHIPISRHELPTGTQILDWTVPKEWNISDAYIATPDGRRIIDFRRNTLHVVNYSTPVRARVPLAELKTRIKTLPEMPDAIPYRTSFYSETWGFCMSQNQLRELEAIGGDFDILIDSRLEDGVLTWGEVFLPGESDDEVLLTTHICHPSLANDNCSGLALLTLLGRALAQRKNRLSYRLVFMPTTIGSIAWLASNEGRLNRIKHGLAISNVGDASGPTYKRSRRGNAAIDRAVAHVIGAVPGANVIDFFPYGYDERQFCSPGFDLPFGLFQRSQFGTYPEYHTSHDNLAFIRPQHLAQSYAWVMQIIDLLDADRTLVNQSPKGEPQLGRRGLYSGYGSGEAAMKRNMALLWVLNLSDGRHSLLDIAERSGVPLPELAQAASDLERCALLAPAAQ